MGHVVTLLISVWVGLAPWALGSNRPLPWAYNAAAAGIIAVLAALMVWRDRRRGQPLRADLLLHPLGLWGLALGWAAIQLLPDGSFGLPSIGWPVAAIPLEGFSPTMTANASETTASLMRFLTYTCLFLAVFAAARDIDRAAILFRALIVAAVLYALYGFLRSTSGADKLLWFDLPHTRAITGPFINRNTAATYFGLASCLSLVLVLRRARHLLDDVEDSRTPRMGAERLMSGIVGTFGFELAIFILLLTATVLSLSRAGVTATLVALLLGLVLQRLRTRHWSSGGPAAVVSFMVGLLAVAAVLQISGAGLIERLADTDFTGEGRIAIFADTLTAIREHAWTGTGLGTFQDIFPIYRNRTGASVLILDKAHNDYLEILLGLGLVFGSAAILAIGLLAWRCLRGTFVRRRNGHLPAAATMATALVGLHALVDFSLQIQAVAMTFITILAIGVAQSVSDREQ